MEIVFFKNLDLCFTFNVSQPFCNLIYMREQTHISVINMHCVSDLPGVSTRLVVFLLS